MLKLVHVRIATTHQSEPTVPNRLTKTAVQLLIVGGVLIATAHRGSAGEKAHPATTAFEILKSLEGTWTGESLVVRQGQKKEEGTASQSTVTYKTIASGTSVMATFLVDTPAEMVSMYHLDGPDELIHTHYCAVGNQPTMQFTESSEAGLIKFEFLRGANMDVKKDGHVHAGTMKRVDDNTLVTETEIWRGGKLWSVRYATLHRE